jgi:hypothetical protein
VKKLDLVLTVAGLGIVLLVVLSVASLQTARQEQPATSRPVFEIIPSHGYAVCKVGKLCEVDLMFVSGRESIANARLNLHFWFTKLGSFRLLFEQPWDTVQMKNGMVNVTYETIFEETGDYVLHVGAYVTDQPPWTPFYRDVNIVVNE